MLKKPCPDVRGWCFQPCLWSQASKRVVADGARAMKFEQARCAHRVHAMFVGASIFHLERRKTFLAIGSLVHVHARLTEASTCDVVDAGQAQCVRRRSNTVQMHRAHGNVHFVAPGTRPTMPLHERSFYAGPPIVNLKTRMAQLVQIFADQLHVPQQVLAGQKA